MLSSAPRNLYDFLNMDLHEVYPDFSDFMDRFLSETQAKYPMTEAAAFMMRLMPGEVPCRSRYSRSQITTACVKKMLDNATLMKGVPKIFEETSPTQCEPYLEDYNKYLRELKIRWGFAKRQYLDLDVPMYSSVSDPWQMRGLTPLDYQIFELVIAVISWTNLSMEAFIYYDHELRLAVDDDDQRRVTRRHIFPAW